nr:MAG TPA: hypothetical protein [Caudoviricetes sp.]
MKVWAYSAVKRRQRTRFPPLPCRQALIQIIPTGSLTALPLWV